MPGIVGRQPKTGRITIRGRDVCREGQQDEVEGQLQDRWRIVGELEQGEGRM